MTSLSVFEPRFRWNRANPIISINLGKILSRFALFGRIESEQRDHIQIWIRRFWLAPSALCISYILWLYRSRLLLILPEWIASHRITLPSSSSALFASSGRLSTPSSTPSSLESNEKERKMRGNKAVPQLKWTVVKRRSLSKARVYRAKLVFHRTLHWREQWMRFRH